VVPGSGVEGIAELPWLSWLPFEPEAAHVCIDHVTVFARILAGALQRSAARAVVEAVAQRQAIPPGRLSARALPAAARAASCRRCFWLARSFARVRLPACWLGHADLAHRPRPQSPALKWLVIS